MPMFSPFLASTVCNLHFWIGAHSPINGARQKLLNQNFAETRALHGVLPALLAEKGAVVNKAVFPLPSGAENLRANFALSQFRHEDFDVVYATEAFSFFAYPVMDSFAPDAKVAGAIASNMFWRLFFSRALPDEGGSFVCVLENSFNQTLSYRVDGSNAIFLGEGDMHDTQYNSLEARADMNDYHAHHMNNPAMRSYKSLPLNTEYGRYTLRVYPTHETEARFLTSKPWTYTCIVVAVSLFTSVLFATFVYFVERRQGILMARVMENANQRAEAERDLNEFLAHEIRNPLSSCIVAHSFIQSNLASEQQPPAIPNKSLRATIQNDNKIVHSSLHLIDDFLKSMLLMYRASANKLEVEVSPTNLYKEVFEPVSNILHPREENIEIFVDCPRDLIVMTDSLRLKQVLLNLGRNASKFVTEGFIRLMATLDADGFVELSVEDSGPGIPEQMQKRLFRKYHTSLDVVTQGNGIGLCLCKNLISLLKGDIWLDEQYDSGITGFPGARFVVNLNVAPLATTEEEEASTGTVATDVDTGGPAPLPAPSAGTLPEQAPPLPDELSVLFVDDDGILRKLFIRSLQKVCPNWTIKGVASGEAALDLTRPGEDEDDNMNGDGGGGTNNVGDIESQVGRGRSTDKYDLIFVDQYMASTEPRLLGTETVIAMRSLGIGSVICGLSANDMETDFMAAGADYFILKPLPCEKEVLEEELLRIVATSSRIRRGA